MKAKQKNLRIFYIEIENEEDFFTYMDKNFILLKDYFLMISGDTTPKIMSFLEEKNMCYKLAEECNLKNFSQTNIGKDNDTIKKNSDQKVVEVTKYIISEMPEENSSTCDKTLLINKPVRSGEEIIHRGDVTVFGRVNSAAKVICSGNAKIYGLIEGLIQCDGDYMVVKDLGKKGFIIFNGDILDRADFNGNLKKIIKTREGIEIKDIL